MLLGNRLVSVGRRTGRESHILALNPATGAQLWRQKGERFVSSVAAVYDRRSLLWYVTGRIFVAGFSADLDQSSVQLRIDCIEAGTGRPLWKNLQSAKLTGFDLAHPLGMFVAQSDSLIYSIGSEGWPLNAKNGSRVPTGIGLTVPDHSSEPKAQHAALWPPSAFGVYSGRFYAFTEDGHAYASRTGYVRN